MSGRNPIKMQEDKSWKLHASLSYIIFIVVVGLPLWWQTTTVYRVGLPRGAIARLATTPVTIKYTVSIVCAEEVEPEMGLVVDSLRHRSGFILSDRLHVDVTYSLHVSAELDELAKFAESCKSIAQFDRFWTANSNRSDPITSGDVADDAAAGKRGLEIVIVPEKSWLKLFGSRRSAHFGSHRSFFVRQFSMEVLENWLDHLVFEAYVDVSGLMSISQDISKDTGKNSTDSDAAGIKQNRLTIPHARYNVDIYLLNPVPAQRDIYFNLSNFMRHFGDPLLEPLRLLSNFSVQTQKLYDPSVSSKIRQNAYSVVADVRTGNSDLNSKNSKGEKEGNPTSDADDSENRSKKSATAQLVLSRSSFPSVMTDIEQKVGTIKEESVLNIFIYFPSSDQIPLVLVDSQRNEVLYNTYLIEGWGSFSVYNGGWGLSEHRDAESPSGGPKGGPTVDELDPAFVYKVLASVLKGIISPGLRFPPEITKSKTPFPEWEVQRITRSTLCHRYLESVKTLESLLKLLDGITNIVINDEVGLAIETSVSHLESAVAHFESGSVDAALTDANSALTYAQRAFFDPTLLALLYFPEDQKYAIYIPLFLPVGVPIVLSLLGILKMAKGKKKNSVEKDK